MDGLGKQTYQIQRLQTLFPTSAIYSICREVSCIDYQPEIKISKIVNPEYGQITRMDSLIVCQSVSTPIEVLTAKETGDGPRGNQTVRIVHNPSNGMVSYEKKGLLTYTSFSSFSGMDSLVYSICDSLGNPLDKVKLVIKVFEKPVVDFSSTLSETGNSVQFTDFSTGLNLISWHWNFGDNHFSKSQNARHTYTSAGKFTASLIVGNAMGCKDSLSIPVVHEKIDLLPNTFSPNGDGSNDVFWIKQEGANVYSIHIFNRWGQEVYAYEGIEIRWNGKSSAGMDLEMGTYFYVLKIKDAINGDSDTNGYISLLK